jgi:hypothetical protein
MRYESKEEGEGKLTDRTCFDVDVGLRVEAELCAAAAPGSERLRLREVAAGGSDSGTGEPARSTFEGELALALEELELELALEELKLALR